MPPIASPTAASDEPARPFVALSAFQLDILAAVALAEDYDDADAPSGLNVKQNLEVSRGEHVHHGRLYPNIQALEDAGLLEREPIDKRTKAVRLTDAGIRQLDIARSRLLAAVTAAEVR